MMLFFKIIGVIFLVLLYLDVSNSVVEEVIAIIKAIELTWVHG